MLIDYYQHCTTLLPASKHTHTLIDMWRERTEPQYKNIMTNTRYVRMITCIYYSTESFIHAWNGIQYCHVLYTLIVNIPAPTMYMLYVRTCVRALVG